MAERAVAAALRASLRSDGSVRGSLPDPPRRTQDHRTGWPRRSSGHDELHGLADAAAWHGIASYVLRAHDEQDLPAAETARLRTVRDATVVQHLRTMADLAVVQRTLDAADVAWIVVKGPTLAEPVHGDVSLRGYSDLDVVVDPQRLGRALEALTAAGVTVVDRNWTLLRDALKGEIRCELPFGTTLDLHWHLLNDRPVREAFTIGIGGALERRVEVRVGDLAVPTLAPADTVVYVALHAVLSGAHRLVWLKDVERLLGTGSVSPGEVAHRARRWSAQLAVCAAVDRTEAAIDGWRGPRVLRRGLRPPDRAWRLVGRAAWEAAPAERQRGQASFGRMFARSVRPTGLGSASALARKAWEHQREDAPLERDVDGRIARSSPGSARYESGGEVARREYLDLVARHPDARRE
jgi:hypothetical protein